MFWSVIHQSGRVEFFNTRKGMKRHLRSREFKSLFAVCNSDMTVFQAIAGGGDPEIVMSIVHDEPTLHKWLSLLDKGFSSGTK